MLTADCYLLELQARIGLELGTRHAFTNRGLHGPGRLEPYYRLGHPDTGLGGRASGRRHARLSWRFGPRFPAPSWFHTYPSRRAVRSRGHRCRCVWNLPADGETWLAVQGAPAMGPFVYI